MFSFLKKKKVDTTKGLVAHISGKVIPIEQVKDEVFSSKMLGDGLGIEPSEENIVSPCDGVVTSIMVESKHAVGITMNNGKRRKRSGGLFFLLFFIMKYFAKIKNFNIS